MLIRCSKHVNLFTFCHATATDCILLFYDVDQQNAAWLWIGGEKDTFFKRVTFIIRPPNQNFIGRHFAVITATIVLGHVPTSFAQLETFIFVHPSLQIILLNVNFQVFRFSIELVSGLWLGYSNTWTCFVQGWTGTIIQTGNLIPPQFYHHTINAKH